VDNDVLWYVPVTISARDSTVELSNFNIVDLRERLGINAIQRLDDNTMRLVAQYYPEQLSGFRVGRSQTQVRALSDPLPPIAPPPTATCPAPVK
jgi:hypothetical protein